MNYGYWKRQFGGSPSAIGKTVRLNNVPFTIVGVADPLFDSLSPGRVYDVWVPLSLLPQIIRWVYLEHRIKQLRREARRRITRDLELDRRHRLMLTVSGIAETSALQLLGELVVLSDTADARQWVAFSGLDPCIFTSGTSVEKRPRISRGGSRHLRRALYMSALVALRREPNLKRFYERLLSRGKARLQAVVAVRRKLLHALFTMFRANQPYDGSKLCSLEPLASRKLV